MDEHETSYATPPDEAADADVFVADQIAEVGARYFTEFAGRFEAERAAAEQEDRATAGR